MIFLNKVKWILGIAIIFVIIITTNLIDKNNFVRVRDSVVTIFEDRLVADDLIFEMAKSIQEKKIAVALFDSNFFNKRNDLVNIDLTRFVSRFETTKLTRSEELLFRDLKENVFELKGFETNFINSKYTNGSALMEKLTLVEEDLYRLSKIQLNEGRRQMSISKKAIGNVELFTQIEIYLLIFLAILIQIIVMYSPKQKEES